MRKAALGLALLASGCSLFAGGGSDRPWECTLVDGGPDPCAEVAAPGERLRCVIPSGQTVGVCSQCEFEICNGTDDDCDGSIDEELDEDGDGYTWCPTGPPPLDCDDGDPRVRPTRAGETPQRDICDGLDNDCDSSTRDGDGECSESQDCDPADDGGTCVMSNCATSPGVCVGDDVFCDESFDPPECRPADMTCFNRDNQCQGDEVCNRVGACVTPREDGVPCDYDAECDSALCLPIGALRVLPTHLAGRSGICGRSCCGDGGCDAGDRCWASGSGARGCVPESLLNMGGGGAPSAGPCAARSDCSGDECRIVSDDAYEVLSRVSLSCGSGGASRACGFFDWCGWGGRCVDGTCQPRGCDNGSQCPTGICASGVCRDTCRSAADCGDGGACVYFPFGDRPAPRNFDYVTVCSYTSSGTGSRSAPCDANIECLDRTCVDAKGTAPSPDGPPTFCADTCCSDTDCQAGEQCRPIQVGGTWQNHCLPRPMFGRLGTRP